MSDVLASALDALAIDGRVLLTQILGFVVVLIVLSKFAFGPITAMLQKRQDNIKGNLDEAQARRDEMVRLQHEYEQRLAHIEEEARDKIQGAVKEAQAARDEIITRAQSEAAAIVERGQQDVERQRQQAMVEMRDQVAELAIQAASKVVHNHLNASNHALLVDEVISSIGRGGVNGTSTHGSLGA